MDGFCNLAGKSALVTGSSRGIGFALARGLGRRGARVFVHGASDSEKLRAARATLAAEGIDATAVVADLARPDGPDELVRQLGPDGVDILVLNASLQLPKPWEEIADEDMLTQYRIDFMSSVRLVQLLQGNAALFFGRLAEALPDLLLVFRAKVVHEPYDAFGAGCANLRAIHAEDERRRALRNLVRIVYGLSQP